MAKSKKTNKKQIKNENEMLKFIKLIIVVTVIFGLFYALTVFINKEDEQNKNEDENVSIQYNEILIGNIFNQSNDNYYVLVEKPTDNNVQAYEAYLSMYSQKKESKRVYFCNLDSVLNLQYNKEETKLSDNISELQFSQTVLLEIENKKIKNSYASDEKIREILKQLTKEETDK